MEKIKLILFYFKFIFSTNKMFRKLTTIIYYLSKGTILMPHKNDDRKIYKKQIDDVYYVLLLSSIFAN